MSPPESVPAGGTGGLDRAGVRRTILRILALPVLVIGLLCVLLAWRVSALLDENRWIVHTHDVIGETWQLSKLLLDHETALRAYLLSRQDGFLDPYRAATTQMPKVFGRLEVLVADNPAAQARFEGLRTHYEAWRREADDTISRARVGDVTKEPGFLDVMMQRKAEMDAMRQTIDGIVGEEGRLLAERQRRADRTTRRLLVGGGLFAFALAIVAAFVLRRLLGSLEASYSEAQRAEAESARRAEEANQAKDAFLATLSHELRTPLNAIVGWSHILGAEGVPPETVRKGAEIVHRNALAQNQLISDILDVSRIVTGKLRLDIRAVDLPEVIREAAETVSPAAQAKGIRLELILKDPAAGPISGDPSRLQQVVWNLLANAIKYAPKGGRAQVRLERVNSHVQVVVEDNGPGIPADLQPHVFERFRQGDISITRSHGGLGLGLAIVRHLVELHGGTVSVANRDERSGAMFTVRLPLRPVAVAMPHEAREVHPRAANALWREAAPSLAGVRVLAVDDEADARELVKEVLSGCGAEVFLASSSGEGLATMVRERPHVVISDVGMPGEDGYSFIATVRSLPRDEGGMTPALALTAFAGSEDRVRALQAGFNMHVAKPVEPVELAIVVRSLAGAAKA